MIDSPRILVVDDEPYITDLLGAALRFEGFSVDVASTGNEALQMSRPARHDLVLLDVMLPDLDGNEVCRRLRAVGVDTPIVFLTAREATEDKVTGLTVGGDDYVTKPFSLEELVARIRAILRRVTGGDKGDSSEMTFEDLVIDEEAHEVWRHGELIELTATEFNLLRYLLVNAKRVVSKSEILDNVWDYDFDGDPSIVETYISYLRKKVDKFSPPLIQTVRGVGYSLRLARDKG
ncbi:MAG: response regulator transcription factor [Acidimicrobiales bacterium]